MSGWWRSWGDHYYADLAQHLRLDTSNLNLDLKLKRQALLVELGHTPKGALQLLRVEMIAFNIESNIAVTCCRAGAVDIWQLSQEVSRCLNVNPQCSML